MKRDWPSTGVWPTQEAQETVPASAESARAQGAQARGFSAACAVLDHCPFHQFQAPGTGSKSYRSQQGLLTVTTKMACESVIDCERPPSCMGRPLPETPGSGARSIPSISVISDKQACSAFNQRVESDHKHLWNE